MSPLGIFLWPSKLQEMQITSNMISASAVAETLEVLRCSVEAPSVWNSRKSSQTKLPNLIHVVAWRCFFRIHDHCNGYMKSIEILWLCVSCPGHWRADQTDLGVRVSCPRIFCAYWWWALCAHVHHVRQDWTSCACAWHELYTADSNHKGSTWLYYCSGVEWYCNQFDCNMHKLVYWTEPAPACFFDIQSNWGIYICAKKTVYKNTFEVSVKSTCFLESCISVYLGCGPLSVCQWPTFLVLWTHFQWGDPNLKTHLPLARWEGATDTSRACSTMAQAD